MPTNEDQTMTLDDITVYMIFKNEILFEWGIPYGGDFGRSAGSICSKGKGDFAPELPGCVMGGSGASGH